MFSLSLSLSRSYSYMYPTMCMKSAIIFYPPPTSQVRMYSPQFMLTISSVDNLESKLNQAQNDLGIPHYNRVPITYRPKTDAGYVYHNECPHSLCHYIRDWFLCVCSDKTTILLSLSPPPSHPPQILVNDGTC